MSRLTLAERQARIAHQRASLQAEESRVREAERKARTRRLIEAGGLIEKAGLGSLEPDALYGALLALGEQIGDADVIKRWAALGGRAFAREAQAKEAARVPLVLTFDAAIAGPISTRLRALGFRWSKVMGHWEGLADPVAAEEIATEHKGKVRQVGSEREPDAS